jgi:hypothetical protein
MTDRDDALRLVAAELLVRVRRNLFVAREDEPFDIAVHRALLALVRDIAGAIEGEHSQASQLREYLHKGLALTSTRQRRRSS